MFLISDKGNVLKPFQQNIVSEMKMKYSAKDFDLLHSACCISLFSSFSTPRIQTFGINVYSKRCHRMYEVISGITSDTSYLSVLTMPSAT